MTDTATKYPRKLERGIREKSPGVLEVRVKGQSKTVRNGIRAARSVRAEMELGNPRTRPRLGARRFGDLLTEWLEQNRREWKERTYDLYVHYIDRHFSALEDVPVAKLRADHFEKLYADLRRGGMEVSSIRRMNAVPSGALDQAMRWGWIAESPMLRVKLPKSPKRTPEHGKKRMPNADEVIALLRAADLEPDYRYSLLLRFVGFTGTRRGEVCGVRWSHIDFEKGVVEVSEGAVDRKGGGAYVHGTKTSNARYVGVPGPLLESLREHQAKQRPPTLDALVWTDDPEGLIPWRPHRVTTAFRRIREDAGVRDNVKLHGWRHRYGSVLHDAGVPLAMIMELMGHSRMSTTADNYLHAAADPDRLAVAAISEAMKA